MHIMTANNYIPLLPACTSLAGVGIIRDVICKGVQAYCCICVCMVIYTVTARAGYGGGKDIVAKYKY